MKPLSLLPIAFVLVALVASAGCTDHTTKCCYNCGFEMTKTSVIHVVNYYNDVYTQHIIDSEGIDYTWTTREELPDGLFSNWNSYDYHNVTFTYKCNKNGFYEITGLVRDNSVQCCHSCCTPTPAPTLCPCQPTPTLTQGCGC